MAPMDPYAPIHGISLERYAELGAELDGITDPAAQEAKVGELGIAAADWNAAKDGWTARMQDMSLMGQVATKYMQLYNAALAKKSGGKFKNCSFEDFCAISAAIQVFGWEAGMNHHGVSQAEWTQISAHWQGEMNKDPMNMGMRKNQLQEQEAARLQSGGQPKHVQFFEVDTGGAPAGAAQGGLDPAAAAQAHMAAGQQQAQHWQAYSAGVLNQPGVQGAMGMLGAMNKLGGGDGLMAGRAVLVQWNDGNKYPATITQDGGAQMQVTFPNGNQMWVERQFLEPQ